MPKPCLIELAKSRSAQTSSLIHANRGYLVDVVFLSFFHARLSPLLIPMNTDRKKIVKTTCILHVDRQAQSQCKLRSQHNSDNVFIL